LPKRGFTNIFRTVYNEVKLEALNRFEEGTVVTPEVMLEAGIVRKLGSDKIKVLGDGKIEKALTVQAHGFTKSAAAKIEAAGGKAEVI
jgi:large subunit ribosomal protein L15